jgi:RNA polymerase sigma-70 factor (ECF subfamily)
MSLDFGQLFERYQGVVYRRCLWLLSNPDDAAEACQDVFESALSGLGRFRLQSAPVTWLYGIATRHCLQLLRNRRSRQLALLLLPVRGDVPADTVSASADLGRLLSALDEAEQELTVYAFRDGMTQDEMADVLRVSRKTVRRRLEALHARVELVLGAASVAGTPSPVGG